MAIALSPVADGLASPLVGTATASLPNHLFVVDQPGQVYQIDLQTGAKSVFLDVAASLVPLGAFGQFDERGLLGFAIHPDYATNGQVYTYQSEPVQGTPTFSTTVPISETANHQSVLAAWTVTEGRLLLDQTTCSTSPSVMAVARMMEMDRALVLIRLRGMAQQATDAMQRTRLAQFCALIPSAQIHQTVSMAFRLITH